MTPMNRRCRVFCKGWRHFGFDAALAEWVARSFAAGTRGRGGAGKRAMVAFGRHLVCGRQRPCRMTRKGAVPGGLPLAGEVMRFIRDVPGLCRSGLRARPGLGLLSGLSEADAIANRRRPSLIAAIAPRRISTGSCRKARNGAGILRETAQLPAWPSDGGGERRCLALRHLGRFA